MNLKKLCHSYQLNFHFKIQGTDHSPYVFNVMDYIESINLHHCLYLVELSEPRDNSLRLVIEEARLSGKKEDIAIGDIRIPDCEQVISTEECAAYEITFKDYIAYSIINESYSMPDEQEQFEGRLWRIYTRSHFLDYLSKATFATADYPGPYHHYGIICSNHTIEVAAVSEPIIQKIRGD